VAGTAADLQQGALAFGLEESQEGGAFGDLPVGQAAGLALFG
jgi:hypothetical protein